MSAPGERLPVRRVVTGLDAQGRSAVVRDGEVPGSGHAARLIWRNAAVPAQSAGNADTSAPVAMEFLHDGGCNFILTELPPGTDAFMHATDTIDYIAVLRGEVVLVLETGEVALKAGDVCVDRGVLHGWRNDRAEAAVFVSVTIPAQPVGAGRTV